MTPWQQSRIYQPPTWAGFQEFAASFPSPEALSGIDDINSRWKSSLIALLAHNSHRDDDHLKNALHLHPLTIEHYRTGKTKLQKASGSDSMSNWRERTLYIDAIRRTTHDLCTMHDRLTGGTTVLLQHPGATEPGIAIKPENLKADVYLNPRMIAAHPELHHVAAEIVQIFVERWALANVQDFRAARESLGWDYSSKGKAPVEYTPHNYFTLPLIPSPISSASTHFIIPGRPHGVLQELALSQQVKSSVPSLANNAIIWESTDVPTSSSDTIPAPITPSPSAHLAHTSPQAKKKNADVVVVPALPRSASADSAKATPLKMTPSTSTSSFTSSHKPVRITTYDDSDTYPEAPEIWTFQDSSSTQPHIVNKGRSAQFHSSPISFAGFSSPSQSNRSPSKPQPIRIFGTHTSAALRANGLPDKIHRLCFRLVEDLTPEKWANELIAFEGAGNITPEMAEAIARAMIIGRSRPPRVRVSAEVQAQLNQRRNDKRLSEDQDVQDVLDYIENRATDLAIKHHRPRRRYLERFLIGSSARHCRHAKTSAWSAYMHFKGKADNADKMDGAKDNLTELVKTSEYHTLSTEERQQLITEFDCLKAKR
ncbi:hypothetical protein BJ138DRAFT_1107992, partial [Hygrophoropsis aurantiaca]